MIKHLFLWSVLALLLSCEKSEVWVATQPQMPLLTKKNNMMLAVTNMQKESEITSVEVYLSATRRLSDISQVEAFVSETSDFSLAKSLGKSLLKDGKALIKGAVTLPYRGTFFLRARVSDNVDLLNKVSVEKVRLHTKKGKFIDIKMSPDNQPQRTGITLRNRFQDRIDTYRIPGLATTNNGTLIAVYDNRHDGPVDLQGDIDVGMSRSTDGGQNWEPMKTIIDMGKYGGKGEDENGVGDPAVLVDKTNNTIWVSALWQHGDKGKRAWWASKPGLAPEKTGQMILVKSEDDGKTWSSPINITEQVKDSAWYLFFDGPGRGITLKDGTLLFAAQYKDEKQIPHSTIMYSKDAGKTWQSGIGAESHTTESQVVQLDNGAIMLNMRDDRNRPSVRIASESMKNLEQISRQQSLTWWDSFDRANFPQISTKERTVRFRMGRGAMSNIRLIPLITGDFVAVPSYTVQDTYPYLNDNRFARTVMITTDMGKTWTPHISSRSALPSSNCMASIISVEREGKPQLYFFSNPSVKLRRNHITIKMSDDEAVTWNKYPPVVLYEGETYGYSCMTPIENGKYIGILYEGAGDLYFQKIPVSDFFQQKQDK